MLCEQLLYLDIVQELSLGEAEDLERLLSGNEATLDP